MTRCGPFKLYGKTEDFGWYESSDPGTHNYQLFNRLQSYHFFDEHFHLTAVPDEIPSSGEVRTPQELAIGVPTDNLTILGLAKKLAASQHPAGHSAGRRGRKGQAEASGPLPPVSVDHAWRFGNTKRMTIRTVSYRFDLSNGLSATGVWLQAVGATDDAPLTIVLNDKGYAFAGEVVAEHVNRGEQVLALDTIFIGSAYPESPDPGRLAAVGSKFG